MKVIKPTAFADSMLISTTATETSPGWLAGTAYAKGAVVDYQTHLYESLQNNNTGNVPSTSATFWLQTGPDNTHAMFDDSISTQTTASGTLTVVLAPGLINSVSLIGLIGSTATITATDGAGGPVLFDKTFDLDGAVLGDWYQYFFEPASQLNEVTVTNIPPYGSVRLTVTVTGNPVAAIGNLVFGSVYDLGGTLAKPSLKTDDYSLVTTDAFGKTTLTRRNSSKRIEAQLMLNRGQLSKIYQLLNDLRATPCVWVTSDRPDDAPLTVFGIRSSFNIVVEYNTHALCSIEVKGMT